MYIYIYIYFSNFISIISIEKDIIFSILQKRKYKLRNWERLNYDHELHYYMAETILNPGCMGLLLGLRSILIVYSFCLTPKTGIWVNSIVLILCKSKQAQDSKVAKLSSMKCQWASTRSSHCERVQWACLWCVLLESSQRRRPISQLMGQLWAACCKLGNANTALKTFKFSFKNKTKITCYLNKELSPGLLLF